MDDLREQHTVSRGSGSVLLVDDAPDVLATAGAFLERAGFAVVRAASGEEGLMLLMEGKFDAVVSDQGMAGMSGTELIGRARALRPQLAALLITGFTEVGGTETLPDPVAVLRKPFQRRELIEAVLRAMGQNPKPRGTSPVGP